MTNKFNIGDRVLIHMPGKKPNFGICVGFSRNKFYIRVLHDGLKSAYTYHPDFITLKDSAKDDGGTK